MEFYHVDTQGELEANSTLQLRTHRNDIGPYPYAGGHSAFKEGISPWGYGKTWVDLREEGARSDLILRDWIFELYRRDNDIPAPSRFQCLFVCKTLEEAEELFYKEKPKDEEGRIFQVSSDEAYGPYYYNWFGGNWLPAEMYWRAEKYWNNAPFYHDGKVGLTEYLLPLPCEIGEEVQSVQKEIDQEDSANHSDPDQRQNQDSTEQSDPTS